MKTYQKLLGTSCLALYLVGCGSGGGGESPVEIRVSNNGDFQIRSKADSVTIQGVKLNRGNCVVNFKGGPMSIEDLKNAESFMGMLDMPMGETENRISQLEQKGVMMESQTLKFGESLKGISKGYNIIEAEIQTDKGAWTFNFNR
ncbi:hypothetical protein L6505_00485 [Helicobacter pylori]|uniref:hypothetical protein n=1 Tax=Helicobacter pylori TaxID=210 RepID=UPI001EDC0FB6|nr:hypothetical protein [Helicobacter pylori]UKJ10159.1 hypothetical protein L6505_00485 [Helicobacter pylori]UKJ10937.1 hypothetical protein L6503_04780 [Helicobacter pylori]UOS10263.1 hypothetical protein MPG73_00500 [Helicobacter pylori]